ncbi:TIGR03862 family flavoprotein [Pigmentiphaga soli]|uniref:TIGR03862 family flavoprotein n=1 Tax=Pigmentiphaga soli TaxID=1007095 RepID=A0ABP8HND4_9BURK
MVGAGPAGLMAAETLAAGGCRVDIYDAMPSAGRKFLLAGKGGMNITHSEPLERFLARYGPRAGALDAIVRGFGPQALRDWVGGLGIGTFVGSSGRVFPTDMKAAPLMRAWLHRLRAAGAALHMRHRWLGWDDAGGLRFDAPGGPLAVAADAAVLALGGGSWPRLGSDGAWAAVLGARGVRVAPLAPSNCGFDVGWSEHLRQRCAGQPVRSVHASFVGADGRQWRRAGEFVLTDGGVEGTLIYALSAGLRDAIAAHGQVTLWLDLAPGLGPERVAAELTRPRGTRSMSSHLRSRVRIDGAKAALLREVVGAQGWGDPLRLAAAIKRLPIVLRAPRPLAEAISSAGGVDFAELDDGLMLRRMPGVFCAGEMLDWEAPTGGYLLTACFATGRRAGAGALAWLAARGGKPEAEKA